MISSKGERLGGQKVKAMSLSQIRKIANGINQKYTQPNSCVDILHLIEIDLGYEIEVLKEGDLLGVHALAFPEQGKIQVEESLYQKASKGDGFSRFTLAHELGHLELHKGQQGLEPFAFNRYTHKAYEDSEWQANSFAAELLMPISEVINLQECQIISRYKVSKEAAQVRIKKIRG